MLFDNITPTLQYVQSGRLRALAVTAPQRLAVIPEVPTMAETGFPGFDVSAWLGLAVPAVTDPAIVRKFQDEVQGALADPQLRKRLEEGDATPSFLNAGTFRELVAREIPRWAAVLDAADVGTD